MQHPRRTGFDAHDLARDAAILVLELVTTVRPELRSLADQTVRATTSVALNLAEGAGRQGRDRIHHWRISYGSALEARTALELLVATGSVDAEAAAAADVLLDRVAGLFFRVTPWRWKNRDRLDVDVAMPRPARRSQSSSSV